MRCEEESERVFVLYVEEYQLFQQIIERKKPRSSYYAKLLAKISLLFITTSFNCFF